MINIFEAYVNRFSSENNTMGTALKSQSDVIMANTWDRDIQSKTCYLYDYYHDSNKELMYGYDPEKDKLKKKVNAKFIVAQYGTTSQDQVEYHLQFKPGDSNIPSYYKESFSDRYNSEFPIGLYIDIPDESGVYRKWLICAKDKNIQFVKYIILPCNYLFQWIFNNIKYTMCGIAKLRNSYSSGVWADYMTTTVENQDQIWLPINSISTGLYYDQRIIVSALIEKPLTWYITKIENIHPFGILKFTISQTKFDPVRDLVNVSTKEMYADYYSSTITPESPQTPVIETSNYGVISVLGINNIKYKGNKIFSVSYFSQNGDKILGASTNSWKVTSNGVDITSSDSIVLTATDLMYNNSIQINVIKEDIVGTVMNVYAYTEFNSIQCESIIELEVCY